MTSSHGIVTHDKLPNKKSIIEGLHPEDFGDYSYSSSRIFLDNL